MTRPPRGSTLRQLSVASTVACGALVAGRAGAHHEALFGPQSSLAVESEGFVSVQAHEHVFGTGSSYDQETAYIVSAGVSPMTVSSSGSPLPMG